MLSFHKNQTLSQFQSFIGDVYGLPDSRLYSIEDLLVHQQRFTMRAIKGIRKDNKEKIRVNLLISFSWLMAIVNRLHIDIENETWKRFPALCSYCGQNSCVCKKIKISGRRKIKINNSLKPVDLNEFQEMFAMIYNPKQRILADAGVHLAEEMGEVSEAIHNYLGQHKQTQFKEVEIELADYVSCIFGVANSVGINIAEELEKIFYKNCHVCHKAPCTCSFAVVANIKT